MRLRFTRWPGWYGAGLAVMLALLTGLTAWGVVQVWPAGPAIKEGGKAETPRHVAPSKLLDVTIARLHNDALAQFASNPGFGVRRMVFFSVPKVKVAKEWKQPWWSPGELDQAIPIAFAKDLESIHSDTLENFGTLPANLKGFATDSPSAVSLAAEGGMVVHRRERPWEVKNIDLVGLLTHPEPTVYMSEKIVEMKQLEQYPTRPLDAFELAGLNTLQRGEELFVRSRDEVVRVLGAVRAKGDCLKCHNDSKEGDLLGAFSYTLREAEYRVAQQPTEGSLKLHNGSSMPLP